MRHWLIVWSILVGAVVALQAATRTMPDQCASVSACMAGMASGDTLIIRDGTYSALVENVKAGVTIQAEHDGLVTFTGGFDPGNAGFTMRGIVVKSSSQKDLGAGNRYERMSFVGGPSCGNTVNALLGARTQIYESAFYGRGGRYLLLAYQQTGGITLQDLIFRPDGGWGQASGCSESEPHAAYNMYDTEGFTITRAIVVDALSQASNSENIGGQVVNTHSGHGAVGTIAQSIITASAGYGRFASDGLGSHSVTITDSVSRGNGYEWGLTRNVNGTTTATRLDTDAKIGAFKGSVNRTAGAVLTLNSNFLNAARWRTELCAGVTRGWCGTSQTLSAYVSSRSGVPEGTKVAPAPPTNVRILP